MAFPTTVTTDGIANLGAAGPYLSSGGNVYTIVMDDQQFDLRALKGSDPATAFSSVGVDVVIGAGSDLIRAMDAYQVSDKIHVLTKNCEAFNNGPVDIRYHIFNMATDSWSTTNEMVKTNMSAEAGLFIWEAPVGITVRADGVVIACYNGLYETIATVNYDRVYYARRIGGTWSADIALGTAGVAASWSPGRAISGSNNRVHFIMQDATNQDLYQRTITSGYSMEALPAPFETTIDEGAAHDQRGVYCTALDAISMPFYTGWQTFDRAVFASADVPTVSVDQDITSATLALTVPIAHEISHAVDGTDVWSAFIDTSNDIYVHKNTSGTGWTSPTSIVTGSASAVYTSVYVRGAAKVLGILYMDVNPTYTEYTLSVSNAASLSLPNGFLLMGVGR